MLMIMTLSHIHYTNVYRQTHARSENASYDTLSNSSPPRQPLITKPHIFDTTHGAIWSKTETDLTSTIRYQNGSISKVFKPAFYKNPSAARQELGSFLETLSTRSWQQGQVQGVGVPVTNSFFSYLPMGGGNNQFTSLQKAALLAKDLNRTLVIPPISPNSHIKVWAGPRYSEFYDLDTFSDKTGIPVLEWHDLKQTPENPPDSLTHHWADFSEDFPCIPNGKIGVNDTNLFDHFRSQFLLNFKTARPSSGSDSDTGDGVYNGEVEDVTQGTSTEYNYARDVLLRDGTPSAVGNGGNKNHGQRELWKCLSCPYFLARADLSDRIWNEIGLHLRFNDQIEAMADQILDLLLPSKVKQESTGAPVRRHPEFIIVHLRRGDIVNKCAPGQDEKECLVQIEAIAEKVDEIEKQRRIQALESVKENGKNNTTDKNVILERLPVLVTTNEKRAEELEKLAKLGWTLLDHGDPEDDSSSSSGSSSVSRNIKLGTMSSLGPFYPPMLDAVLLTRGDYFIGMKNSRMSQLAAQRGSAWHGHKIILM
ncbi:hypothetical protein BGZ50_005556 [Haplosporangium sp. Z 11]|nr:hypothetical protein BGZ50_005556 [Haplosporangium sp. Z 11]